MNRERTLKGWRRAAKKFYTEHPQVYSRVPCLTPEQIEQIERNRQRRSGSLVGLEFSRLMVWDYAGGRYWWCLCACGDFIRATVRELQSGQRKDCGCLRRERERISKYREAA